MLAESQSADLLATGLQIQLQGKGYFSLETVRFLRGVSEQITTTLPVFRSTTRLLLWEIDSFTIWNWNAERSPKDLFGSAHGIPAPLKLSKLRMRVSTARWDATWPKGLFARDPTRRKKSMKEFLSDAKAAESPFTKLGKLTDHFRRNPRNVRRPLRWKTLAAIQRTGPLSKETLSSSQKLVRKELQNIQLLFQSNLAKSAAALCRLVVRTIRPR
jgi:hypothetical protein